MLSDATELPTLGTDRLVLRALAPSDAPALFDIFGDPAVCRYWSRPALPNLDAATELQAEIARHFAARTLFQWGIEGMRWQHQPEHDLPLVQCSHTAARQA